MSTPCATSLPEAVYVWWSDIDQEWRIRKWDMTPFIEGSKYVREGVAVSETLPVTGDTPRTDAVVDMPSAGFSDHIKKIDALENLARQLERELAHMAGLLAGQLRYNEANPVAVSARVTPDSALDEAAEIAGREWHAFSQTKEAHERNSPEPFRLNDFNFDWNKVTYSRDCMERILALKGKS